MTRNTIAWLSGMVLLFAGQRLYAGHDKLSTGLSFVGLGIVVAAIILRALSLHSALAKSHGLPSSSSVVRSSAKPGLTPSVGIILSAFVTRGSL